MKAVRVRQDLYSLAKIVKHKQWAKFVQVHVPSLQMEHGNGVKEHLLIRIGTEDVRIYQENDVFIIEGTITEGLKRFFNNLGYELKE